MCPIHFSKCLQRNIKSYFQLLTREGFIKMLSLVARNGQGIGTSILAQWANKVLSMNVCADDQTDYDSLIENIYQEIENRKCFQCYFC